MGDNTIGIDIDHKNQTRLLKTYFNARMIAEPVDVRETRHGFHLKIQKRTSILRQIEANNMKKSDNRAKVLLDSYWMLPFLQSRVKPMEAHKTTSPLIQVPTPYPQMLIISPGCLASNC